MPSKLLAAIFAMLGAIKRAFVRQMENLAFMTAWVLITWSIVGHSPRGWSASVGIYLLVFALLGILPQFFKATPVPPAPLPRHPNDV